MVDRTETIRQDIDAVRDSMTDTMEQIETRVKGTVDTTVAQVKRTVDIKQHIADRPWVALGVAVAVGYGLGSMGSESDDYSAERTTSDDDYSARRTTTPDSAVYASARAAQEPQSRSAHKPKIITGVMDQFQDEITMLKSAAVAVGMSMLRDTIQQKLPQVAQLYQRAKQETNTVPSSPMAHTSATTRMRETVEPHSNGIRS